MPSFKTMTFLECCCCLWLMFQAGRMNRRVSQLIFIPCWQLSNARRDAPQFKWTTTFFFLSVSGHRETKLCIFSAWAVSGRVEIAAAALRLKARFVRSSGDLRWVHLGEQDGRKRERKKCSHGVGGRRRRRREWVMRTASCPPLWDSFKVLHLLTRRAAERPSGAGLSEVRFREEQPLASTQGEQRSLQEAPNQKRLLLCSSDVWEIHSSYNNSCFLRRKDLLLKMSNT